MIARHDEPRAPVRRAAGGGRARRRPGASQPASARGRGAARDAGDPGPAGRAPWPSSTAPSRAAPSCCSTRSSTVSRASGARARCRRAARRSWRRRTSCAAAPTSTSACRRRPRSSFRSLIQLQPGYTLCKEKVSPKIVDHFNSVKKALVGYLAVTSRPAGARVSLNGKFLGLTDFFPLEVLAGEYTVEVSREGYQTETRSREHRAAARPRRSSWSCCAPLASLFFVTEPAGVEIWLDGQLRATTSGTLAPEYAEAVRAKGLDPRAPRRARRSPTSRWAPTSSSCGKKCYEAVRARWRSRRPQDYDAEPVRLEESLASLRAALGPARRAHLHRRREPGRDAQGRWRASAPASTASRSSTPRASSSRTSCWPGTRRSASTARSGPAWRSWASWRRAPPASAWPPRWRRSSLAEPGQAHDAQLRARAARDGGPHARSRAADPQGPRARRRAPTPTRSAR